MTASSPKPQVTTPESEPKLRHEFVGMMFAVAVGEVGVQTATLVQAHNWVHFLPAYFHLLLATVLIATSWVGWTLSPSPGARTDVRNIFEWEFFVLLLDMLLVVIYFILAKSVDITGEKNIQLKASAAPEAFWVLVVFCVYLVWDFVSKVPLYTKKKRSEPWFRNYGVRIIPTLVCLILAYVTKRLVADIDAPHVLTADLALIFLVLLFRALKDLTSALFPRAEVHEDLVRTKRVRAIVWSLSFGLCFVLGLMWTRLWPIPERIAAAIETVRSDKIAVESRIPIQPPVEATAEH
jgi:hypothetical protein